jgi:hypothetical protein
MTSVTGRGPPAPYRAAALALALAPALALALDSGNTPPKIEYTNLEVAPRESRFAET